MDPQVINLLERVAIALESQAPEQGEKLGFIDRTGNKYVSIGNEGDGEYLWHTWDKVNERQVPIYKTTLAGHLKGLEVRENAYKGKAVFKVNLIFDCGRETIVLQSGLDTTFSRGAILSLARVPVARLKDRIVISVKPGNEKTVLCSVTVGSEWIKSDWNDDPLEPLIAQVNRNLGYTPRTAEAGYKTDLQEDQIREASNREWQSKEVRSAIDQAPFNTGKPAEPSGNEVADLIAQIDVELKMLGWDATKGREFLLTNYQKKSRSVLSIDELRDFLRQLKQIKAKQLADDIF